jgi:hypothetical protein
MIKFLIIAVVTTNILFVLALCKNSKRADINAQIILKKHKNDKKDENKIIESTSMTRNM